MWLGSGGAARESAQKEKSRTDTECKGEEGASIEGDKERRKEGRQAGRKKKKKKGSEDVKRDEKGALKVTGGSGGMLLLSGIRLRSFPRSLAPLL